MANKLVTGVTSIDIVNNVFERGLFKSIFDFIEAHIKEFLGVLLNTGVNWLSLEIFKRFAEFLGVVIDSIGLFQKSEHLL